MDNNFYYLPFSFFSGSILFIIFFEWIIKYFLEVFLYYLYLYPTLDFYKIICKNKLALRTYLIQSAMKCINCFMKFNCCFNCSEEGVFKKMFPIWKLQTILCMHCIVYKWMYMRRICLSMQMYSVIK